MNRNRLLSHYEDLLVANAEKAEREDARIKALRDGTEAGELKADYLERIYQRKRTNDALAVLASAGVVEETNPQRAQYTAEIRQIDAELPEIETKLDALGIRVKKTMGLPQVTEAGELATSSGDVDDRRNLIGPPSVEIHGKFATDEDECPRCGVRAYLNHTDCGDLCDGCLAETDATKR